MLCDLAKQALGSTGTCSETLQLLSHHHILTSIYKLALPVFPAFNPGHKALGGPGLRPKDSTTLTIRSPKVTHLHISECYRCGYNSEGNMQPKDRELQQK